MLSFRAIPTYFVIVMDLVSLAGVTIVPVLVPTSNDKYGPVYVKDVHGDSRQNCVCIC